MWFFSSDELEIKEMAKDFALKELKTQAAIHDEDETFNINAFKKMGELGVLGLTAHEDFGGSGLGATHATIVMEEFGKQCASTTLSYLAHSILCVNNINSNGSLEQKKKYLPKLISGEWIGAMGMSEPAHGSDAVGIQTKAEEKDSHFLINGTKMWITNAQYADVVYLYTRTGVEKKNLSTFIVEKGTPGFSIGKPIHKMGMRGSPTGELVFENAKVPKDQLVGKVGDSIYHMMKNLDIERITISGISLGIAKACLEQCIQYAGERSQFGKTIGEFQLIQKMIAEMSTEVAMMESFLYSTAKEYDRGNRSPHLAAQVKLAIPKMCTKIALDAIQLHGGYGYSREFPLERYLRDNKLNEIGAGTNEVMILIIAKQLLKHSKI